MKKIYRTADMDAIVSEIRSYIGQLPQEERASYEQELGNVKDDFVSLVNSGVFHDACGKVLDLRHVDGAYEVTLSTEY